MAPRTDSSPAFAFGVVFYFFEDPGEVRAELAHVLKSFGACFDQPFRRISTSGDRFSAFKREDAADYVCELLGEHDFGRSLFITLTDGGKQNAVTQRILLWARRIDPEFKSKTPNYLYFELPDWIDRELVLTKLEDSFAAHDFHLVMGNSVLTVNEEQMPRSGSQAAKRLTSSDEFLVSLDSSFRHLSYLQVLARKGEAFLLHPSEFLGVGRRLRSQLDVPALQKASKDSDRALAIYPLDDALLVHAQSEEGLVAFSKANAAHYETVDPPRMFWRSEAWEEWLTRLRSDAPGAIHRGDA